MIKREFQYSNEPLAKVLGKRIEKTFLTEFESISYRVLISNPSELILRMVFYPLGIWVSRHQPSFWLFIGLNLRV